MLQAACSLPSLQRKPSSLCSLQPMLGRKEMGAELVLLIPPHCFLLDVRVPPHPGTLPKMPKFSLVISALLPALALFRGYHSAEIWSPTPALWLVELLRHRIYLIQFQVS